MMILGDFNSNKSINYIRKNSKSKCFKSFNLRVSLNFHDMKSFHNILKYPFLIFKLLKKIFCPDLIEKVYVTVVSVAFL